MSQSPEPPALIVVAAPLAGVAILGLIWWLL